MADEDDDTNSGDDTAAELAALRKEKADRKAAEDKAKEEELAALRKYKEDTEAAKSRAPKPTKPKAEKEDKPEDKQEDKPKDDAPSHGASSRWFSPPKKGRNT